MADQDPAPVWLFSYGTLQQPRVQVAAFGRLLQGEADALPGYRQDMVRIVAPTVIAASGADHHPIVRASGDPADEVAGAVFRVTDAELKAADAYEVDDYRRVSVRLKSGRTAWVYVEAGGATGSDMGGGGPISRSS